MRSHGGVPCCRQEAIAARAAEEEGMARRIEAAVQERVEAAMASELVQKRIEARLREERAALEQKVQRILLEACVGCECVTIEA